MDTISAEVESKAASNEPEKNMERILWLDSVKGIGILLVVIGHCLIDANTLRNWIYSFHVPLFFLISGFLTASRNDDTQIPSRAECCQYAKNKLRAYIYPYITFSGISLVWYIFFYIFLGYTPSESLPIVVLKMVTTYGHNACWFLPALFWTCVISFFTRRTGHNRPLVIAIMAILGCTAATLVYNLPIFLDKQCYALRYVFRILIAVSFDYIGELVYRWLKYCSVKAERILLLICAVISIGLFPLNQDVSLFAIRIHNCFLFYSLALAGSMFIILLCKNTFLGKSRLLVFLGRNSLIIMALHMEFPKEMGWIFVGATKLTTILSTSYASICVGIIASTVSALCAVWISRHCTFLVRCPQKMSKKNN